MYRYQLLTYPHGPHAADARAALAEMPVGAGPAVAPAGQPYARRPPPADAVTHDASSPGPGRRRANHEGTKGGRPRCDGRADLAAVPRPPLSGCSACCVLAPCSRGCGYQAAGVGDPDPKSGYQWRSLYREDVQTVAVPVFANRTFRRGLESDLTTAVIQQLEEHSPYKVVPADRADTVLEGVITDADTTTLSTDTYTGLPQEQSYNITVSFTWKNLRTGQVYAQRRDYDQHTSYYPTLGEPTSIGSTDAAQHLATGIVQEMQADW